MVISNNTHSHRQRKKIKKTMIRLIEENERWGERGSLGGNGIQCRGHENSMRRSHRARLRRKVVD
jgi:hypothetical protein